MKSLNAKLVLSLLLTCLPSIEGMSLTFDDDLSGKWDMTIKSHDGTEDAMQLTFYASDITHEYEGQACNVYLLEGEFLKAKSMAACLIKNIEGSPYHFLAVWYIVPETSWLKVGGAWINRIEGDSFILGRPMPNKDFAELGTMTRTEQFPPSPISP